MRMVPLSLAPILARLVLVVAIALAASGCGVGEGLMTSGIAAPGARAALDNNPTLLVATTRRASAERPWFGTQRARSPVGSPPW
jgi:hypothetical protein